MIKLILMCCGAGLCIFTIPLLMLWQQTRKAPRIDGRPSVWSEIKKAVSDTLNRRL